MRRICLILLITGYLYRPDVSAQTPALRGIYIDKFSQILGNTSKEDSLLHYAQDSSFNYLALYDLHVINFSNSSSVNALASFIRRARLTYGIPYIGAVGETFSLFQSKIGPYNNNHVDVNEKFNVFNLEFEFWTASSVNPGGVYCTSYLQAGGCSCDTAGAFRYFIQQLHKIDSLATLQSAISETYLGWFNQGQAQQIVQNVDRILLHSYRTDPSSVYSYAKTRLGYLASLNQVINVAPIFSSEPVFMGPWLNGHAQIAAYNKYYADFTADNSSWKPYINLQGFHWFDYGYMPHPIPGSGTPGSPAPFITAAGPTSFCIGSSVVLTASTGTAYLWSTGATTQSITVSNSGAYSCNVTSGGTTRTTPVCNIAVNNAPAVSIMVGTPTPSGIPLAGSASPGSGSISSYQWYLNGSAISGGSALNYIAVQSGNYSLKAVNTTGCSAVSAIEAVSVSIPPSNTCVLVTPSGLNSFNVSPSSVTVVWNPMEQSDSIVVRYKVEGTSVYNYVRMANTGQTSLGLTNLRPNSRYSWRVKTICGTTTGSYSAKKYFTTTPGSSTALNDRNPEVDIDGQEDELIAFPNPASEQLRLYFYSESENTSEMTVIDPEGRIVEQSQPNLIEGENMLELDVRTYSPGIYFISLKNSDHLLMKRILVQR